MFTRREFGKLALAGIPLSALAAKINSVVGGVRLGCITYGWSDIPRSPGATDLTDPWLGLFKEVGLGECELMCNVLEPPRAILPRGDAQPRPAGDGQGQRGRGAPSPEGLKAREDLRQWRLSTPMSHFKAVRKKFDSAGVTIYAYTVNIMTDDFTEAELDKMFEQAKALGAGVISSSTTLVIARKLAPFAEKHKMIVAMHGHADVEDPIQFATPESYAKAFEMSRYFMANADIGHMTAANFDPVPFIEKNHARINFLHFKDRKKNQGQNVPWGEGDTPIKEVLLLIKKNKYRIPCYIEFEYNVPEGSTSIAEFKKCLAYMKQALA